MIGFKWVYGELHDSYGLVGYLRIDKPIRTKGDTTLQWDFVGFVHYIGPRVDLGYSLYTCLQIGREQSNRIKISE